MAPKFRHYPIAWSVTVYATQLYELVSQYAIAKCNWTARARQQRERAMTSRLPQKRTMQEVGDIDARAILAPGKQLCHARHLRRGGGSSRGPSTSWSPLNWTIFLPFTP